MRPLFHRGAWRRAAGRASAWLAASCLVACGGGSDGDAPEQVKPEIVALGGSFHTADANLSPGEITVKGVKGLARPGAVTAAFTYSAKLDQLDGPYAVGLAVVDESTGAGSFIVSLATTAGTVNVTPLTTLVSAELLGQAPGPFFAGLAISGDALLDGVDDAAIEAAQRRLGRHLKQWYGLTLPAADLVTTPFSPSKGDAVHDLAAALQARLAAEGGNIIGLAERIANEAALCNAEDLRIDSASGAALPATLPTDFCPKSKRADPDAADAGLSHHRFTTAAGAVLAVDARDATVLAVTLSDSAGIAHGCRAADCAGLTIGPADADLRRTLTFAALRLSGSAGTLVLDGTLASAVPGVNLPPLPCDINRYFIVYPDRSVAATCAASDDIGFGAGQTRVLGATRRQYLFSTDGSVDPPPPSIEVRADGDTVASVVVFDADPQTGANRVLYKCSGSDCAGVSVGPAADDVASFAPYVIRVRPIVLRDTVLAAVRPDGTLSGSDGVTLQGALNSVEIIAPPPAAATAPCADPAQRIVASHGGGSVVDVCPPVDDQGFPPSAFLETRSDADDLLLHIGSLWVDGIGSAQIGGVDIRLSAGVVSEVRYAEFDALFGCSGSACGGVAVSAPDAAGRRSVSVVNARLTEIEMGNLPGTRSVTLQGGFVAPPPTPVAAGAEAGKRQAPRRGAGR